MNQFNIPKNLEVRFVSESIGYGVFTTAPIKKDDIVEISYCLEFDNFISHFLDYLYIHPITEKKLLALGYATLYNHDQNGNIRWYYVEGNQKFIKFLADRDIEANEELRHNYGDLYWKAKNRKLL